MQRIGFHTPFNDFKFKYVQTRSTIFFIIKYVFFIFKNIINHPVIPQLWRVHIRESLTLNIKTPITGPHSIKSAHPKHQLFLECAVNISKQII